MYFEGVIRCDQTLLLMVAARIEIEKNIDRSRQNAYRKKKKVPKSSGVSFQSIGRFVEFFPITKLCSERFPELLEFVEFFL